MTQTAPVFDKDPVLGNVIKTFGPLKITTTEGIPKGSALLVPPKKLNETLDELATRSVLIKSEEGTKS